MVNPGDIFAKVNIPPQKVTIFLNGTAIEADLGETILSVLIRVGHQKIRLSSKTRDWRGFYCGMGSCFECLVCVDGIPNVRACITPISAGMQVILGDQLDR